MHRLKTGSGLTPAWASICRRSAPTSGVSSWCSRDPDVNNTAVWFFRRVRDRNPDSCAAGTPGPPSWNGSLLVPPARRTPSERGERTSEARTNAVNSPARSRVYRRVTWFLGHIVPDTLDSRRIRPAIAIDVHLVPWPFACRDRSFRSLETKRLNISFLFQYYLAEVSRYRSWLVWVAYDCFIKVWETCYELYYWCVCVCATLRKLFDILYTVKFVVV